MASRRLLLENTVDRAIVIPALRIGALGILKGKAIGNRVLSVINSTRQVTTTRVPLRWAMMDLLTELSSPLSAVRCLTVDRATLLGVLYAGR